MSAGLSLLGFAALVLRRWTLCLVAIAGLVTVNRSFYGLLLRRRGGTTTIAGVGLHALHHLVSIAAIPFGIRRYLRERPPAAP